MSLDDELKKAVQQSERDAAKGAASPAEPVTSSPEVEPPKRNVGLLISLLVMGIAVVALVTLVISPNKEDGALTYAMTVKDLAAGGGKEGNLRVTGQLVSGTLVKRDTPCEYRFAIESGGATREIHYPQCIVPDTLRDVRGMPTEVTVEGKLNSAGHFDAAHVMAKCPSKYDMDQMKAQGRKMDQVPIRTVEDFENN